MTEYIEKGRFKGEYLCCGVLPEMSEEEFDRFPVADAAPVVHGHWIAWTPPEELRHMAPSYACSVCNKNAAFVVDGIEPIPPNLFNRLIYHYCPHCGAKMDKEDGDGLEAP